VRPEGRCRGTKGPGIEKSLRSVGDSYLPHKHSLPYWDLGIPSASDVSQQLFLLNQKALGEMV